MTMTDVIVEQSFESPVSHHKVLALVDCECLDLLRIELRQSFVSADGCRMVSWFRAPDAESVRTLFRQAGMGVGAVWPTTIESMAE